MKSSVFGNFDDKSTFIESLSKVNNCLESFFQNSKFPDLDEEITLDSFLTEVLPNLTKHILTHLQDIKITNEPFFAQIKQLIQYYLLLIQGNDIKISSQLLQILISIYSNFLSFLHNDVYNLKENFGLETINSIFKLAQSNTKYLDIFILVLIMILIDNNDIDDSSFIITYITEFEKSISTFNYSKTDSSIYIQIFCIFDRILSAFSTFSENGSDRPNFFNTFLNFSFKSLQACQSIEKQRASLRYINSKINGVNYSLDSSSSNIKTQGNNEFEAYMFDYKPSSDSIDSSGKSNSLDIVNEFSIQKETVTKNPLFVHYILKFNPLISLINVDGHKDILQEVSIVIQKVCKIYNLTDSIPDKITPEILAHFASRIESSYRSQKKIFVINFVNVFTCLCKASDKLAIEFLQNVNHKSETNENKEEKESNESNKDDDQNNASISNVMISNSTLFEIGNNLESYSSVLNYILKIFETDIYEKNDDSTIPYVVKLSNKSIIYIKNQLDYCLDILKTKEKPQECIYKMLTALISIMNRTDIESLFSSLILLLNTKNDENFLKLIETVLIESNIRLKKKEALAIIEKFCGDDDDGWKSIYNIYNSRQLHFINSSHALMTLLTTFCKSKKTPNSLAFLRAAFPRLLEIYEFAENYTIYNNIFSSLLIDYVNYENYECIEKFIQIIIYLDDNEKIYIMKYIINYKLKEYALNAYQYRAFDFFRTLIEKVEWNKDFSNFGVFKKMKYKTFKRLKKLKKPSDSFTIHVSFTAMNTPLTFNIDVTPDTMINDICIYFAVGASTISNSIEIYTLGDDTYYYYADNMKTDSMYTILPKFQTMKELDINEETDLKVFTSEGVRPFNFQTYFPSEILSDSQIPIILYNILSITNDNRLAKSAWKLLALLKPFDIEQVNQASRDKFYTKLLFLKTFSYTVKENPRMITSNIFALILPYVINLINIERLSGKLLKAALSVIAYNEVADYIAFGGEQLQDILINNFNDSKSEALLEKILIVLGILQKTKKVRNFEYYITQNDSFLNKCISLYSSKSFKNKDLITNLFSNFSAKSKKSTFDFYSNAFLEKSENCFTLLKATYSSECEVKDLFNRCIKIFLDDDNNLSDQSFNELASFIDFILNNNDSLITESSNISLQLISKGFGEINIQKQNKIFTILLHYIINENKSNDKEIAINAVIQLYNSFKTERWNYDPDLHKKPTSFCGLKTLGMTCYMNSILQQIAHNSFFRNTLFRLDDQSNTIVIALQNLVARLELSNKPFVDTADFAKEYKSKANSDFNPAVQEDAAEFFQFLIDNLPKELQASFRGELTNTFEGLNVSYSKSVTEQFYLFAIPVTMQFSEAMKSNFEEEMLIGNNRYDSEKFGKIDVSLNKRIAKLPNTFVIQLKRFEYSIKTHNRKKITKSFAFPLSFNSRDYFENENENESCPNIEYILKGVVIHTGSSEGGHYNSLVKIDDKWINFNDSEVEILDDSRFDSLTKGGSSRRSCAYLLFYVACDPNTHQIIDKIISPKDDADKEKEIKDTQIPSDLINEIKEENISFRQMQCILSRSTASFTCKTSSIDIVLPYFLNVFSHSSMTKSSVKVTQLINSLLDKDQTKGFNFFFENKNENSANINKTINVLINGNDDLAQPFILLLNSLIQSKSKSYSEDNKDDLKNDEEVLLLLLKATKENSSSWKSIDRFGNLINTFVDSYKNLLADPQFKMKICLRIIDVISSFYDITISELSLKQVNFSKYFSILSSMNEYIENVEVLDAFINKIKDKVNMSSANLFNFNLLLNSINKRKGIVTDEDESTEEVTKDGIRIFNYQKEFQAIENTNKITEMDLFSHIQICNKQNDTFALLYSIDDNDDEKLISFLISTECNCLSLLKICLNKDPQYNMKDLYQLVYQKPLIISRIGIIPEFKSILAYLYQTAFNGIRISFTDQYINPQFAQPIIYTKVYRFLINSFKMYSRMTDYPYTFNSINYQVGFIYSLILNTINYFSEKQKADLFHYLESTFLSFTSYVDINSSSSNDQNIFYLHGKERRKHTSLNILNILFMYPCFDKKFLIDSFDKYSDYYIWYTTILPSSNEQEFDLAIIVIFEKTFIQRPDLLLRLMKSDIFVYTLKNSSKNVMFFKLMESFSKNEEITQFITLQLMPKMPLTVILDGRFLKMAVDNSLLLSSHLDEAKNFISKLISEFFSNVSTIIERNRFFSSMVDISKIIDNLSNSDASVFVLNESIKNAFIQNFLSVMNKSNYNQAASQFILSLSTQNDSFANFVIQSLSIILDSKLDGKVQTVTIDQISVKNDVISTSNCWQMISMIFEYATDFDNSIIPVAKNLVKSIQLKESETENHQACFEKLALFVDDSNASQLRNLFDSVLSEQSIKITDQIACFLTEMIKCLTEEDKKELVLGTGVFLYDLESIDSFVHSFKIFVLLLQNSEDPKSIVKELKENYDDIFDSFDQWPEECKQFKSLFDLE